MSGVVTVDPWAGMIGQVAARDRLERAVDNPVHAYLFLGRSGTGSYRAALGFAGLLLAARQDDTEAADRAVRLALEAKHPDLTVVRAEGAALRVTEAETIIRAGLRSPMEADRKVIVVVGVDSIEEAAIGKLLKVIEEPPPSAVFILLADEVPPEIVTIASRCVPVEFGPLLEAELIAALESDGVDADRAAIAAAAAAGDLDRARLLSTDDGLAARADLWASLPGQLSGLARSGADAGGGGAGSLACQLVDQVQEGMKEAQGPLEARQAAELEDLEARVEQLGERGSGRADLVARHRREVRKLRSDELRFGLAVLSRTYRDRLVAGPDPAAEEALAAIQETVENLKFNPNEALLLQYLFLRLAA